MIISYSSSEGGDNAPKSCLPIAKLKKSEEEEQDDDDEEEEGGKIVLRTRTAAS